MKKAIIDCIRRYQIVTFTQLEKEIEGFCVKDGEEGKLLCPSDQENVCIWGGMSNEACDVMVDLLESKTVNHHCDQIILLLYAIERNVPDMPIAREDQDYTQYHWLPTVLSLNNDYRGNHTLH